MMVSINCPHNKKVTENIIINNLIICKNDSSITLKNLL